MVETNELKSLKESIGTDHCAKVVFEKVAIFSSIIIRCLERI